MKTVTADTKKKTHSDHLKLTTLKIKSEIEIDAKLSSNTHTLKQYSNK